MTKRKCMYTRDPTAAAQLALDRHCHLAASLQTIDKTFHQGKIVMSIHMLDTGMKNTNLAERATHGDDAHFVWKPVSQNPIPFDNILPTHKIQTKSRKIIVNDKSINYHKNNFFNFGCDATCMDFIFHLKTQCKSQLKINQKMHQNNQRKERRMQH